MSLLGFSINLLTLFALVLPLVRWSISHRGGRGGGARFDVGYKSSYMATNDAMQGITGAIITSTFVFMAVFIPVSMMGGTSGVFYTQFGITMAVAVGLSAVNALTLSARVVRSDAATLCRCGRQGAGEFRSPFPQGVQCRFLGDGEALCTWCYLVCTPPFCGMGDTGCRCCAPCPSDEKHTDGTCPRTRIRERSW